MNWGEQYHRKLALEIDILFIACIEVIQVVYGSIDFGFSSRNVSCRGINL